MMQSKWFKLTIPKGKRKQRAHKKYLKKSGVGEYLKQAEDKIHEYTDIFNISEAAYHEVSKPYGDMVGIVIHRGDDE